MSQELAETTAAISSEFFAEPDKYERWYRDHGATVGGFPGVWTYVAEAAICFEEEWNSFPSDNEPEWVDCVMEYGALLLAEPPMLIQAREDLARRIMEEDVNERLIALAESINDSRRGA